MKLSSNELAKHLAKAIHSIYFISGVEDLLIIESLDTIRKAASNNDYTDKTTFTVSGQFIGVRLIVVSKISLYLEVSSS